MTFCVHFSSHSRTIASGKQDHYTSNKKKSSCRKIITTNQERYGKIAKQSIRQRKRSRQPCRIVETFRVREAKERKSKSTSSLSSRNSLPKSTLFWLSDSVKTQYRFFYSKFPSRSSSNSTTLDSYNKDTGPPRSKPTIESAFLQPRVPSVQTALQSVKAWPRSHF